ncbi:MAG: hypothetical protein A2939_01070 [Parcubacteria group bacterium RIFCSPLOWO2_01_FULL_48_18]|nr:MAG: hypothetical protein A3J67_01310 [Parcubacteria group bacterium RIFCSPHIGHO2_02_FULL_48_10b]OHB22063.1 MAG: hypothetical protein A2939_01070 [Parcubacteria group bacterium RIFCSPLOWO2_01_FULL_48_18]
MRKKYVRGQTIFEILIGLTIAAIIISSVAVALAIMLRSNEETKQAQSASFFLQEYVDTVQVIAESDWHAIYDLSPKGATTTYRVAASGTQYAVQSGSETSSIDAIEFTRYFSIEDVCRDTSGNITTVAPCGGSDAGDPSTQKITVYSTWTYRGGEARSLSTVHYLSRWQNDAFGQTDWSGGSGQDGVLTSPDNRFSTSTNISGVSTGTGSIILEGY